MDDVLSHDFGNILGDFENNDSDQDQEDEENRQREIEGLLDEQFNSISSIGEEDDSDDPDSVSCEKTNGKGLTSAPRARSPPRVTKNHNNIGTIPEESFNGSFEDAAENARREADKTGDGIHVNYLIDQNNHLTAETSKLKTHLSIVSGDYEGLQFKYQLLQNELNDKDREILQLKGQVSALEMKVQAEIEAKNEYSRKFFLAESAIQSLQNQMSDLSKSDCLVRLQNNHDTLIKKLKDEHENELFALREKIENLVINVENKQSRILQLEMELKMCTSEIKKRPSQESSKSSPSTKSNNTALFESLQFTKKELETAMQSNQELRCQVDVTKKQLIDLKNQNNDICSILRDKDQLINELRAESRSINIQNQEIDDKLKLLQKNHRIQADVVDSKDTQINQLELLLNSANKEIEELKISNSKLHEKLRSLKGQRFDKDERFTLEDVQRMAKEANEEWRKSIEEKFVEKLSKLEASYENSKEEIVRDARDRMMKQLEECVEALCSWIQGLVQNVVKPLDHEILKVLSPVRDLWLQIEESFESHSRKLIAKRHEAEEAKRQLEEVYKSSLQQPHRDTSSLYRELDEVKKKLDEQARKIRKYKTMCKDLQVNKAKEMENLKAQCTELLRNKKLHYEEKEEMLKNQLLDQWNENIDKAFKDALKDVKNQADAILEQTQRKSRDLLMVAVKTYHEAVVGKINSQPASTVVSNGSSGERIISKDVCVF